MREQKYDAVVIGAGLGGLSAAGYLAKAGKRVLVLENHTVPGGYAHEFRRGRFRFDVSLHALDGAGPGGWAFPILRDLGVLRRVPFQRIDPFYTVSFPEHEVTAHADLFEYEAELIRSFPHEAENVRSLFDDMLAIYWEVRRFIMDGELDRRLPVEQIPGQFPGLLESMGQSWQAKMDQHIQDNRLQAVLSTLWGYFGLPPSELNAAAFIFPWVSYHVFGAYYPEGGSMAISRALEAELLEHGGEILYSQTVKKIAMENGLAHAVETEQDLYVEADVIISNASAPSTMLKMVGADYLPDEYVRRVDEALANPALSNLVVYLGLEEDLQSKGWKHHELFVSPSYDLDDEYKKIRAGKFDEASFVMTNYSLLDPGCAPQGNSVLSLFSLAPWDYADQWGTGGKLNAYSKQPNYLEIKQKAADQLIDRAERELPGLRSSIKFIEIGTPLTNYRYSLNPAGSIYGSAQTVDNMYFGRLRETTPIDNLFMAGAWVFGGGMSAAMLSGRNAARAALSHLDDTQLSYLTGIQASALDQLEHDRVLAEKEMIGDFPVGPYQAASSNRLLKLDELGLPAILIVHSPETAEKASDVNVKLRERFPLASQLLIINIVDLRQVPRVFRRIAQGAMSKSFEQAAKNVPEGLNPAEYVIVLPDWEGKLSNFAGFAEANRYIGLLAIDRKGQVRGTYQGEKALPVSVALAEKVT